MATRLTYRHLPIAHPGLTVSSDLAEAARAMAPLVLANIASASHPIVSPAGRHALPGCVIASPSFPDAGAGLMVTDQDYVFHWVRDAAIAVMQMAPWDQAPASLFEDYLRFCHVAQKAGAGIGFACFRVDATPRDGSDPGERGWSEQSDGPALRLLSILAAWPHLGPDSLNLARQVVLADLAYLQTAWRLPTTNLWEEAIGHTFFSRAVHRRAFRQALAFQDPAIQAAIDRPALSLAIDELAADLEAHWDAETGCYCAILAPTNPRGDRLDASLALAAALGEVTLDDPRLMASLEKLIAWSEAEFPINAEDRGLGLGPLIGRYPGDLYDGDVADGGVAQPWALTSAAVAEYLYRLAALWRKRGAKAPINALADPFLARFGITPGEAGKSAAIKLRTGGDAILNAILRHADHGHLSEQFDRETGFEKSVRDLTWSYAAFVSAVRAREAE